MGKRYEALETGDVTEEGWEKKRHEMDTEEGKNRT